MRCFSAMTAGMTVAGTMVAGSKPAARRPAERGGALESTDIGRDVVSRVSEEMRLVSMAGSSSEICFCSGVVGVVCVVSGDGDCTGASTTGLLVGTSFSGIRGCLAALLSEVTVFGLLATVPACEEGLTTFLMGTAGSLSRLVAPSGAPQQFKKERKPFFLGGCDCVDVGAVALCLPAVAAEGFVVDMSV